MSENAVTRAIAERGVAVGAMMFEFDTPGIMRILAAAGADFALFDLEHTGWDAGSLRRVLAAGRGTGLYPISRVVRAEYELIAPALDAGSRGIMAPMVESREDAERLVAAAKYPPLGRRGFGVLQSDELAGRAGRAGRAVKPREPRHRPDRVGGRDRERRRDRLGARRRRRLAGAVRPVAVAGRPRPVRRRRPTWRRSTA